MNWPVEHGGLCKRFAKWCMLPKDVDEVTESHGYCDCDLWKNKCKIYKK